MGALTSSAACALMIGVLAVAFIGLAGRRRSEPDGELEQLRREVADLRQQRADREPLL